MNPPSLPEILTLTPGPDTTGRALSWLEAIAAREGWEPRTRQAILLSADEALTNIVMYAFESGKWSRNEPRIRIECWSCTETVRLDLIDNGVPFDPTRTEVPPPPRDLETAQIGGHGLRLMHHYLSAIRYSHAQGCNRLSLIRQRRQNNSI